MKMIKGMGNEFFALDIGTSAVRVLQLTQTGADSWALVRYGHSAIDAKIVASDSTEDRRRLADVIMTVLGQSGIKTRNVVVGLPSTKTFTTIVDVPNMPENELRATMKYQIEQYIPTSADDTQTDWALLGQSINDPSQQEVLITSVGRAYSESRLEFIENLGLNIIAAEPDPIAMVRPLVAAGSQDIKIIINIGEQTTDLAITYGEAPRLIRAVPLGLNSFVKASVQNLNVQEDQARQFILKFGLAPDKLEGKVVQAVSGVLDEFVTELMRSLKFFQNRYPTAKINGVYLTGYGMVIPGFGAFLTEKTGIAVQAANPWSKVTVSESDRQSLGPVAFEFATVIGLAQRSDLS